MIRVNALVSCFAGNHFILQTFSHDELLIEQPHEHTIVGFRFVSIEEG
jgi:hypothetical protein